MRILLSVVAVVLLAACTEEAWLTGEARDTYFREKHAAADNAWCADIGIGPTDGRYADCRIVARMLREDQAAAEAATRTASSSALMGLGLGLMQSGQPYTVPVAPVAPPPLLGIPRFTCTQVGQDTICY